MVKDIGNQDMVAINEYLFFDLFLRAYVGGWKEGKELLSNSTFFIDPFSIFIALVLPLERQAAT